ncbi:tRNA lysidine(34) synthetase TilS [Candidatus Erwinia haradaeae]|uniref:tRNA(Ile)-lysidine synthase n=1 Tax=Candidatus Erwinia haradaeae TaxID=1922217 RepID=A0A451DPL6_9GAMM|nr:tRNA lysidine(34) synthetase TilS [Candidatus Erwinia haradaeae]VFP88718.1 tRNA(Ile)-lysidine synthase [Candidatus Erwinia haradaeae]
MFDINYLKYLLKDENAVVIAYSGGLDSSVLLHQLVMLREERLDFHFRAIHINHGLNDSSDVWASHCEQQCKVWKISFFLDRVDIYCHKKVGLEAAAREVRYQALYKTMTKEETLLTAHHQDDQSETVLLALKRGSGPAGLSAMAQIKTHGNHRHIRPLLMRTRSELEAWANYYHLSWITDNSNQDMRYDRNFLRLQIMPLLNKRWPSFSRTVSRSAQLCAEQGSVLDEMLEESLYKLMDRSNALYFLPLNSMSVARRFAIFRRWILYQNGTLPSRNVLQKIWTEVACSRLDANPKLKIWKYEVRRFRNRLYWLPITKPLGNCQLFWSFPWLTLLLPDGLGEIRQSSRGIILRCPQFNTKVSVRFQAEGKFYVHGRSGKRSLKKLWQEYGIPPWRRQRIPLIFYNDCLVTALSVFVTVDGVPLPDGKKWSISWENSNALLSSNNSCKGINNN